MSLVFSLRPPPSQEPANLDEGIHLPGTNGSAVILVHGLTGTPNEMRFIAWFLQSHGYTVMCPRLANHGRPLDILQRTSWREFYSSVESSFWKLKSTHKQVYAGGLSMGALLCLELAANVGLDLAGVCCLSPTFFYDGWNVPWYQVLLNLAPWTGLEECFYFKEKPPYGLKNERIRERVHQFYDQAKLEDIRDVDRFGYPFFPVRLLSELRRLVRHLTPRLPEVKSPCQVIQARNDDMSSVRNAQLIHDRVSSKRKEIVYLEDSYHVITADQERGKVANHMLEFLNGCAPNAALPEKGSGTRYQVYIDFDNTITQGDVLDRLIEHFAVGDMWRSFEDEWSFGRIGAKACLDGQLRTMRGAWIQYERLLATVELDAGFAKLRDLLKSEGVQLTILSDNFDRFIAPVLQRTGHADLPVCANHVEFDQEQPLPSFPYYNPECPGCAHCKKTHFVPRRDQRKVIYIGDGRSDICPSKHADIVFAKSSLLRYMQESSRPCHPFDNLAQVADTLRIIFHEQLN